MLSPGHPQEHTQRTLEFSWGEEEARPVIKALMERALTRTRGPWSPVPVEVSTSSPGQMTHIAAEQTKERQSFFRDV